MVLIKIPPRRVCGSQRSFTEGVPVILLTVPKQNYHPTFVGNRNHWPTFADLHKPRVLKEESLGKWDTHKWELPKPGGKAWMGNTADARQ